MHLLGEASDIMQKRVQICDQNVDKRDQNKDINLGKSSA